MLVLEARDRVAGRGWTSTFPGTDLSIELGGAWFTEHQPLVRDELKRYGLGVREFEPVTLDPLATPATGCGSTRRSPPTTTRSTSRLAADDDRRRGDGRRVRRPALRSCRSTGTSTRSRHRATVRDLPYGWWSITGGGDPAEGCVEGVLGAMTSPKGRSATWATSATRRSQAGRRSPSAMARAPGRRARLASRSRSVFHDDDSVTRPHRARGDHRVGAASSPCPSTPSRTSRFDPSLPTRSQDGVRHQRRQGVQGVAAHTGRPPPRSGVRPGPRRSTGSTATAPTTTRRSSSGSGGRSRLRPRPTRRRRSRRCAPSSRTPSCSRTPRTTGSPTLRASAPGSTPPAGRPRPAPHVENFPPSDAWRSPRPTSPAEHAGWFEGALVSGRDAARAVLDGVLH